MNDLAALKVTIVQLLVAATGLANNQFRFFDGKKQPPKSGTYCTVAWVTSDIHGKPSRRYVDAVSGTPDTLDEQIHVSSKFTLSLNFYRTDANQYADNLKGAMYRNSVRATLFQSALGWLGIGPINDLTAAFSGKFEERAQVNIYLAADGYSAEEVNQALSIDVYTEDGDHPEVPVFYAYDTQDQAYFLAFPNEPEAA